MLLKSHKMCYSLKTVYSSPILIKYELSLSNELDFVETCIQYAIYCEFSKV